MDMTERTACYYEWEREATSSKENAMGERRILRTAQKSNMFGNSST